MLDDTEPVIITCRNCVGSGEYFWDEIADWVPCEICFGEGCIEQP